jgi:hypothetical protein
MMIKLNEIFGLKVGIGVMVTFLILYFVFFPLCVAWALNYLFNLSIAYTFDTWMAVTVLHGFFHGIVKSK